MAPVRAAAVAEDPALGAEALWPENRVNGFDVFSRPRFRVIDGGLADGIRDFGLSVRKTASAKTDDQIGSTRAITNSSGTKEATYTFDPYGNVLSCTGATVTIGGTNKCTGTISVSNPFDFQGQYRDDESNLYYLRARYYDPTTAQFLSVDPLVSATRSPYGYAAGNPLNLSDPSGRCGFWCWAGVIAVGAIVVVGVGACVAATDGFCAAVGAGDAAGATGATGAAAYGVGNGDWVPGEGEPEPGQVGGPDPAPPTVTAWGANGSPIPTVSENDLCTEAQGTLQAIRNGASSPYPQDGSTFHNNEGNLPKEPDGYYKEYTVPTPGASDRGAQRLVIGAGGETYYTPDHYSTFQLVQPSS